MRIGMLVGGAPGTTLDQIVAEIDGASRLGLATAWMSQIFGPDALTTLAVAGREVPDIELGTAVVPTYPRHPMVMADQALTTQAASGGRLVLGVGLSHQMVIEDMFGYSFDRPLRHMREYLSILKPLVSQETVEFTGETMRWSGTLDVPGSSPVPVLVAALGPAMLRLAGTVADGTVTWMTGVHTVGDHIVPSITEAAEDAGRPAPRVAVALPVCVTDDPEGARRRAKTAFGFYGQLPSYRAMLDREGLDGPVDIAVIGGEDQVEETVAGLADAGATDFGASVFGSRQDRERTMDLLGRLARAGSAP